MMQRYVRHIPRAVTSSLPRSLRLTSQQWRGYYSCGIQSSSLVPETPRIQCIGSKAFHVSFRSFSIHDNVTAEAVDVEAEMENADMTDVSDKEAHFKDIEGLDPRTLAAMDSMGLSRMTPIQESTYAPIASGKDVLARARTGTGKTFAFLIPAIQRLLEMEPHEIGDKIQVVVLSPTRELALQIDSQVDALLKATDQHPLSHQTIFGGTPKFKDTDRMKRRLPSILVATPGRLADHIKNTTIDGRSFRDMMAHVDILILDEADRYIDMGADIPLIVTSLPKKRQTLLFSATIPKSVLDFLQNFMKQDFEHVDCISADNSDQTVAMIEQSHVVLKEKVVTGVVEIIRHVMELKVGTDIDRPPKIVVFFPTTAMVSYYAKLFNFGLGGSGHYVLEIHSKKSQEYRTSVSQRFRTLEKGILFTSDVSARGVDYPNVTHVIQIGMPSSSESYVHRLGRTGRAGSAGEGILVLTPLEAGFVDLLKGEGIALPIHEKLQSMVEAEDDDSPNKHVRQELHPVMESIRSGKNKALVQAAEDTYRSVLGYYNTQLRLVGYPGPDNLVEFGSFMGVEMGLTRLPGINRKTAGTLGISRVPGLIIDEASQRGRGYAPSRGYNNYDQRGQGGGGGGGGFGNNRGYRPMESRQDNFEQPGNYGSWASGPPSGHSPQPTKPVFMKRRDSPPKGPDDDSWYPSS